jgi:hypothetical protein
MAATCRYSFLSELTPNAVVARVGQTDAMNTTRMAVHLGSLTVYRSKGIHANGEIGFKI